MQVQSLGQEEPLEEGMTTHSSILAWEIPWTEPGGLQSMRSESEVTERVHVHAHTHTYTHTHTVLEHLFLIALIRHLLSK